MDIIVGNDPRLLILSAETTLVMTLILLIYLNNVYFGRKVVSFAREKDFNQLKAVRRRSRAVSMANLLPMLAICSSPWRFRLPPYSGGILEMATHRTLILCMGG